MPPTLAAKMMTDIWHMQSEVQVKEVVKGGTHAIVVVADVFGVIVRHGRLGVRLSCQLDVSMPTCLVVIFIAIPLPVLIINTS
jgi:hypothetical protein